MATPFMGELKIISWNFPPKGWAFCSGQLLPINQNQALFSLLGTSYGGDGRVNFALPDLRARTPMHRGSGFIIGQRGGEENHTLTASEMPAHTHFPMCRPEVGTQPTPPGMTWANNVENPYANTANAAMNPLAITSTGGSQPHNNMSPYLVLNIVIALTGVFPSQA